MPGEIQQERLLQKNGEIEMLPPLFNPHEPQSIYPLAVFGFNPELYKTNNAILRILAKGVEALPGTDYMDHFRVMTFPAMESDVQGTVEFFQRLSAQPTVREGFGYKPEENPLTLEQMTNHYVRLLSGRTNKIVPVSETHLSDLALVRALEQKGVNLREVGLVVVDSHGDFKDIDVEAREHPLKSTFLSSALEMGIGGISIIGMPKTMVDEYVNGTTTYADGKVYTFDEAIQKRFNEGHDTDDLAVQIFAQAGLTHRYYISHSDRLKLFNVFDSQQVSIPNRNKLFTAARKQTEFFKKNGVKHVLISFDVDSLDMFQEGISATDYNPYAKLLLLGLQDLRPLLNRHPQINTPDKLIDMIQVLTINLRNFNSKKPDESNLYYRAHKELMSIVFNDVLQNGLFRLLNPQNRTMNQFFGGMEASGQSSPGGLRISDAEYLIQQTKQLAGSNGLTFGIRALGLAGSISEAVGFDDQGRTAEAVKKIAQALI